MLQESGYSERRGRYCWYYGDLSKLKIILSPDSVIAAIHFDEEIHIYYQGKFFLYHQDNRTTEIIVLDDHSRGTAPESQPIPTSPHLIAIHAAPAEILEPAHASF